MDNGFLSDLDAPIVPKRPLPNGFDPWQRAILDRHLEAQRRYARQLAENGIEVECETCGKRWVVHPTMAHRVHACSQACRDKAYRKRKKNGADRPLHTPAWRPWERRNNGQV